jgi:thymidylate synthase (FAD)|nr:MAG TPA: Thymidylate synthase complementing protein [Caudoviricetes sp.]
MFSEKDFTVTLVNKDEVSQFIKRHGEFACVCYDTPKEQAEKVGLHCLKSGHLSGSRHLYFVFDLQRIPRFTIDQLVRHEVGVVKNVQSLRYVTKGKMDVYAAPDIIKDPLLVRDHYMSEEYAATSYQLTVERMRQKGISKERANEIARTFVPIGIASACSFAVNIEGLIHLANVRLCNRAELPIHYLTQQMIKEVIAVEPRYKEFLVPQCRKLGYCPELKGCGLYEPKKK